MKMGWIRRQSPEKIHPKNQSALERSAAASADAATTAAREAAAAAAITGEHPVLLLDDVLSELDDGRKQYLLTRMREKQTFVTSCDDTAFLKTDGEVYRMNGGVLGKI